MIKLDRPCLDARDVFTTCIKNIRDKDLRQRMQTVTDDIVAASDDFSTAAEKNRLHQIEKQVQVGGLVTKDEMKDVYTNKMAKIGAPGRDFYDRLVMSARHEKCPLCGCRTVSALDHHLPKAHYPALAVTPLNLVPTCSDCNKAKRDCLPTTANEEALHPYFDDVTCDRWLYADVIEGDPAALHFFVNAPKHWEDVFKQRVDRHFHTLKLANLYAAQAADELLNIRHDLKNVHATHGGAERVKFAMSDRAQSCRKAHLNGWRTATFEAFAQSTWFCNGGFGKG